MSAQCTGRQLIPFNSTQNNNKNIYKEERFEARERDRKKIQKCKKFHIYVYR